MSGSPIAYLFFKSLEGSWLFAFPWKGSKCFSLFSDGSGINNGWSPLERLGHQYSFGRVYGVPCNALCVALISRLRGPLFLSGIGKRVAHASPRENYQMIFLLPQAGRVRHALGVAVFARDHVFRSQLPTITDKTKALLLVVFSYWVWEWFRISNLPKKSTIKLETKSADNSMIYGIPLTFSASGVQKLGRDGMWSWGNQGFRN